MYGLTTLGMVHTIISLVAVAAGVVAFFSYGEIRSRARSGQVYVWATVLTCLTSFGIFQHGGFGKPHILGVLTLLVLLLAALASRTILLGRASPYVETVSYSLTFFFHMIPGVTETTTRLPLGKPWVANAGAPALQLAAGGFFLLFLAGATLQVIRMREKARRRATARAARTVSMTII